MNVIRRLPHKKIPAENPSGMTLSHLIPIYSYTQERKINQKGKHIILATTEGGESQFYRTRVERKPSAGTRAELPLQKRVLEC